MVLFSMIFQFFAPRKKTSNSVQCCTMLYNSVQRRGQLSQRSWNFLSGVWHCSVRNSDTCEVQKLKSCYSIPYFLILVNALDFVQRCTESYRIESCTEILGNPRKFSKCQLFAPRKHHFPLGVSNFCSGTIAGSKKILHDVLSWFPDFLDKYSKIFKFREHFCCTILYNAVQICTMLYRNSKIMIWVARSLYYLSVGMGT